MESLRYIFSVCFLYCLITGSINATTLGTGEIYYSATAMRNICFEIYPQHKSITTSGYEQWAAENKQELEKVQSTKHYNKYLLLTENMTRYALTSKQVTMEQFEHKCSNMYEVLSNASNN